MATAKCRICGRRYSDLSIVKNGVCKYCLPKVKEQEKKKNEQKEKKKEQIRIMKEQVKPKEVVKKYVGKEINAREEFRRDRVRMQENGYHVISEVYVPGQYSAFTYIVAVLLLLIFVGILILFYMLIVKPDGTLIVTYEYREEIKEDTKICPDCAETVKAAARKCRFCGYVFSEDQPIS